MIRLQNLCRRPFVCDLEKEPTHVVTTTRSYHDRASGEVAARQAQYLRYRTLTLGPGETSEPLPDSVTENAAIRGAIEKRPPILRVIPA